jgi:integrase
MAFYALDAWVDLSVPFLNARSFIMTKNTGTRMRTWMYTLFEHAKRHEFCDRNPIESVRQGSKPKIKPAILSLGEIRALMAAITTPAIRVAVLVAAVTGLRRSEVRGLKWCDIDLGGGWLTPTRGSVSKHLTNLTNRPSAATIPIPDALVTADVARGDTIPRRR